jgi:hypothetical protein
MTGTNCDLFTHKQSRSYLNHLVHSMTQNLVKVTTECGVSHKNIKYAELIQYKNITQGYHVKYSSVTLNIVYSIP